MKRRHFFKTLAASVAAPAFLLNYKALAVPALNEIKITDVKTMRTSGRILNFVKIETNAGISGIGESYFGYGITDIIMNYLRPHIIGKDPLQVEVLYTSMLKGLQHVGSNFGVTTTAIAGVEIALWDLAGKILGVPVYTLLGGKYHDGVRAYFASGTRNLLDKASCREYADRVKSDPRGFNAVKIDFFGDVRKHGSLTPRFTTKLLAQNTEKFNNLREALGDDIEIAVHCHWEFDWPNALALAHAVAPANPWWLEDPMPTDYADSWVKLTEASPVPIMQGENLYTAQQFKPFIVNKGCHIVQPDIPKAGGLIEAKRIAELADLYYIPVCGHMGAGPLGYVASCHCCVTMRNFLAHEFAQRDKTWEEFIVDYGPAIKDGKFQIYDRPGLGVELNEKSIKSKLLPGEEWWG